MPVPAFRNSRSRVRRRRSHLALKPVRVTIDKETGVMSLPHHQTPVKRVLKAKTGAASAPKSAIKKTVNPASRTKIKAAAAANKPDAKKGGQRKLGQAS